MISIEDYITDGGRGDLMQEIDTAIGDVLERTIRRFVDSGIARNIRRNTIKSIADQILPQHQEENAKEG